MSDINLLTKEEKELIIEFMTNQKVPPNQYAILAKIFLMGKIISTLDHLKGVK